MGLQEGIRFFTREKHTMQSLCVTCGTAEKALWAADGFADVDCLHPVDEDSVYDLASLTKLFTALSLCRLAEQGEIDLKRPVTHYAPAFVHLTDVTVDQVLGYEVNLTTDGRVDAQRDRQAGLEKLEHIKAAAQGDNRFYSDMHAMVLGLLMEKVTGLPLYEVISGLILQPLGMKETWARVPEGRLQDCLCYDREHRIERGRYILREGLRPGVPHDPKAALLGENGKYLCGHAGLFSTRRDMERLCRALLRGELLRPETLRDMSRNRLGREKPEGGWSQYLGSLCYVKHPCQYFSEIPVYMGWQSVGLSGFTGNHVSIDPENGRFALFLGNRVLNRLTMLIPEEGKTREDYGLNPDGTGCIPWPDGSRVWSSYDYVHLKDEHLHREIMREMGWSPCFPETSAPR